MKKEIKKNNYKSLQLQKGMTLIELLVTLSIFMVVTGLTIFDYGSFRSSVSIQNLASDITLAIRKAQSYAIGSHNILLGTATHGYGVHFTSNSSSSSSWSGSNGSFVLFEDGKNSGTADRLYEYSNGGSCGSGNECNEILNITSADRISAIYLGDGTLVPPVGSIDISFVRPNPDALFCYRADASQNTCDRSSDISHVEIKIWNGLAVGSGSKTKTVSVWNTGQISVE